MAARRDGVRNGPGGRPGASPAARAPSRWQFICAHLLNPGANRSARAATRRAALQAHLLLHQARATGRQPFISPLRETVLPRPARTRASLDRPARRHRSASGGSRPQTSPRGPARPVAPPAARASAQGQWQLPARGQSHTASFLKCNVCFSKWKANIDAGRHVFPGRPALPHWPSGLGRYGEEGETRGVGISDNSPPLGPPLEPPLGQPGQAVVSYRPFGRYRPGPRPGRAAGWAAS